MEIRFLGPLEAIEAEGVIALGGPKQRLVLAHLAIHAGEVVSADRLIDEVWGEDPPATARATLQSYISNLRKALGSERIAGHRHGYALRADASEIDGLRFEALAAEGRRQLRDDPAAARESLTGALALWRGAPFTDLGDEPSLQPAVARLEEQRVAVLEDRLAADLTLGRHGEVVAELEALVVSHPLRERLWEQLMVALYRCGRQSESLNAFTRAHTLLAEELGIDPSPALQRVHEQVLRQDPALEPPARRAVTTNLPRPRTSFVGRERDRAVLEHALGEQRLVTLTGPGGAGKTRLAIEVARGALDRFEAVYFVDLSPLSDGAFVADVTCGVLGLSRGGGAARDGRSAVRDIVRFLASGRALIVLDNCEHLVEPAAELADQILDGAERVVILATSREVLDVEGERVWPVTPLAVPEDDSAGDDPDQTEALRLLLERARAVRPDLEVTETNRAAWTRICRHLDGIPLALELAAARMAHLAPAELEARLADRFALLGGGRRRPERQQTLRAMVDWSYDLLDGDEQALLCRLSVFAGGCTLSAIEGVCSDGLRHPVIDLLRSLVAKSLVQIEQEGAATRYRLLETIRLYGREQLAVAAQDALLRSRHRDWYLDWAESFPLDQALMSQATADALEVEHDNLRAALEWSREERRFDLMARILVASTAMFVFNGHAAEADRWMDLAAAAPDLPPDLAAGLRICAAFARGWRWTGDRSFWADMPAQAAALAAALPEDHPLGAVAWILVSAGHIATSRDPERAEACADEAIARARRAGAPLVEGLGLLMKARARMYRTDYESALTILHEATSVPGWSAEHDPAVTLMDVGIAHHLVGEHAQALDAVMPIVERHGSVWRHLGLVVAGIAAAGLGDQERAGAYLDEAVTVVREGRWHHPLASYDCLAGYGARTAIAGDHSAALRLLAAVRAMSFPGMFVIVRHYRAAASAALDAQTTSHCTAEGAELDVDTALAEARAAASPS